MSSPAQPVRVAHPAEIAQIRAARTAVIEASAGTGKTYVLEHLVVDLVLSGVPLDEILVVTFTEKATAELRRRVRDKLASVLATPTSDPSAAEAWSIDERARGLLRTALGAADRAPIATIHGFCQRVLTEHAFGQGHPFGLELVDGPTSFGAAFRATLRNELATAPVLRPWLETWLRTSGDLDRLERLLRDVAGAAGHARLGPAWNPEALVSIFKALADAAPDLEAVRAALRTAKVHPSTVKAICERLATLVPLARAVRAPSDLPALFEGIEAEGKNQTLLVYLVDALPKIATAPALAPLAAAIESLGAALPPWEAAVAGALLPPIQARLRRDKRAAGTIDFDDMLDLVAESLAGPEGSTLTAELRRRYRVALIDEFQDTDDRQWGIFKRVFLESTSNALYVIGDPKQAIYGFRGADVRTYLRARDEIQAAGGVVVHLTHNFRSTEPLVRACNTVFGAEGDSAFFMGSVRYDHPVACGRPERRARRADGSALPPLALLTLDAPDQKLRSGTMKRALCDGIARAIASLLAAPPLIDEDSGARPLRPNDIYVLTRVRSEADEVGEALRRHRVPHAFYKQDGLWKTPEAEAVEALLAAIVDPSDRAARLRAFLTPFFGLDLSMLDALESAEATGPLVERLLAWKALADAHELEQLFARIIDDSGLVRRQLYFGETERAVTNVLHILEILQTELAEARLDLPQLVWRVARWRSGAASVSEADVQRLETERQSVQLLTWHKSKGLEAAVVFVYGGFFRFRGRTSVHHHHAYGHREAHVGKPRLPAIVAAITTDRDEEDERLLYVALTRARARLVLPYIGTVGEAASDVEGQDAPSELDIVERFDGPYARLHARLRSIVREPALRGRMDPLDTLVAPVSPAPPATPSARPSPTLGGTLPAPLLATSEAWRAHAGALITSYSALKRAQERQAEAHTDVVEPDDALLESEVDPAETPPSAPDAETLPPGADTGILIHELIEEIPLESLDDTGLDFPTWWARSAVREPIEARVAASRLGGRWAMACAQIAHAALTTPLPRPAQPRLPALGRLARPPLRELELLYPVPATAPADDARASARGPAFIKGILDAVVEHEGRVYGVDWKSDQLPTALPTGLTEALTSYATEHYGLQLRLYTLGLMRLLSIADAASYAARFGGFFYVFLRAQPLGDGVVLLRPSWEDVTTWERDLASDPTIALLASGR